MGSDILFLALILLVLYFNPRSPCGERLRGEVTNLSDAVFQSTLPVWGATIGGSIQQMTTPISIHAPRVGSDADQLLGGAARELFQSTLPVWGATGNGRHRIRRRRISIHAPRVGSDGFILARLGLGGYFNPRSPCGERHLYSPLCVMRSGFQSTLPVWGATKCHRKRCATDLISIHAPRVGSDRGGSGVPRPRRYFNPRSPCGERPGAAAAAETGAGHFNPRSPCGERLIRYPIDGGALEISIHAPRVGSDWF